MWITPSLRVAVPGVKPGKALATIKAGGDAVVETLDDARTVMRKLNMTDEQIEDRIHFALTGEVLQVRSARHV